MNRVNIEKASTAELVDRFAAICLNQDQALLYGDTAGFNKIYQEMVVIREELKRRAGDQRSALLALYQHESAQVRLQAARATLAMAPEAARALIEDIAASRKYPQAMDAGMTLSNLDRGVFIPN